MAHPLQTLVQQLGRAAARNGLSRLADAELLRRFKTDRDPLAFEAIIWRHGMMVLGVCRRVLGQRGDAEDTFQATFLALIRYAPSVRSGESLAGWLLPRGTAAKHPCELPEGAPDSSRISSRKSGSGLRRRLRSLRVASNFGS